MRILAAIAAASVLAACSMVEGDRVMATPSTAVTGTLFVANKRDASLTRVDLATGEETHREPTCENPHELSVSGDGTRVLVGCYSGDGVNIHRTADLALVRSVELGARARVHSAAWLADGRGFVAGAEGRGSLFIARGEDQREIGGSGSGTGPHMVVANSDDTLAWGTIIPLGAVVRYDLVSGEETARRRVGRDIEALALSPDEQSLWVASNSDATVYRLDPTTLATQADIAVGEVPIRLAAHPSGRWVVTSNFGGGDLSVIDTQTNAVVRTIPVSGGEGAVQVTLVFSPDGSRLYAAETARDAIAEIDFASGEVLRRLPTGPGGDGLAVVD